MDVQPLDGKPFGAEVRGVTIADGDIDADSARRLATLLVQHNGLLVLRGQQTLQHHPLQFLRFARAVTAAAGATVDFDEDERSTAFAEGKQLFGGNECYLPGFPDIRRIGNLHEHGGREPVRDTRED